MLCVKPLGHEEDAKSVDDYVASYKSNLKEKKKLYLDAPSVSGSSLTG